MLFVIILRSSFVFCQKHIGKGFLVSQSVYMELMNTDFGGRNFGLVEQSFRTWETMQFDDATFSLNRESKILFENIMNYIFGDLDILDSDKIDDTNSVQQNTFLMQNDSEKKTIIFEILV